MVCLGPRKKEKKPTSFLSPESAGGTRSVKGAKTPTTRKSVASLASIATKKSSTSPRTSLDKQPKRPTSRTPIAAANARSPSPERRTANSRPPPPPGAAPSARNSARPTAHSRNSSVASSIRKSPVAQMREEFEEMKLKNNEHLQLIAKQKAELEYLKQQLSKQQQQRQQQQKSAKEEDSPPRLSMSQEALDEVLREKEQRLEDQQRELEQLRKQLEQDKEKRVPSIVVSKEEGQALAERERALEEKERALEEERRKWESSQTNVEEVAAQLERLKHENEEAVRRLADKEKELEALRTKIDNQASVGEEDAAKLQKIEELNKQLEAAKLAHEESLRRHEEALKEKERLLSEQQEALDKLQEAHEEEIRKLKSSQTSSILALKQRHKEDMAGLQERLAEAEKKLAQNPDNMNEEIERILKEFEQAEHTHAVQIQDLQQSHESELSNLQQNHVAQMQNLRKAQDKTRQGWTSRYLPTEAVSWPAPQPLSILRKTNGPAPRKSASKKIMAAAADAQNDGPVLIPLDNKKVQIYISTVSGNPVIKRNQEHIQQLLKTHNVEFELIDVAASEAALQYMKRCNNQGSSEGRAKEVPQIFVGGEYRGQYADVVRAIDEESLDTLLRPAAERKLTEEEKAAIKKAEAAKLNNNNDPAHAPPVRVLPPGPVQMPTLRKTPGPVRAYRGTEDDDEALFKELEREMSEGKVADLDIADL